MCYGAVRVHMICVFAAYCLSAVHSRSQRKSEWNKNLHNVNEKEKKSATETTTKQHKRKEKKKPDHVLEVNVQ